MIMLHEYDTVTEEVKITELPTPLDNESVEIEYTGKSFTINYDDGSYSQPVMVVPLDSKYILCYRYIYQDDRWIVKQEYIKIKKDFVNDLFKELEDVLK